MFLLEVGSPGFGLCSAHACKVRQAQACEASQEAIDLQAWLFHVEPLKPEAHAIFYSLTWRRLYSRPQPDGDLPVAGLLEQTL